MKTVRTRSYVVVAFSSVAAIETEALIARTTRLNTIAVSRKIASLRLLSLSSLTMWSWAWLSTAKTSIVRARRMAVA